MPIPEQYRKQFEQQRQMAEMRSQLDKQYKKEMSKVALNDMPSFAEWMAKRTKRKAPYEDAHEAARKNAIKMLGLHENNTAQDRAKAMGFDLETYHGTDAPDIESLDPERTKIIKGVFSTTNPKMASRYAEDERKRAKEKTAPNVLPLLIKSSSHQAIPKYDINTINDYKNRGAKGVYRPEMQTAVTFDPSQIRSRFAAFDPAREHEHDLLAAKGGSIHMSLKEMEEYIRQKRGEFGAKRVQRAADEIPNLESMYTPEALKHTFERQNAGLMSMNPSDFEKFAERMREDITSKNAKRKTREDNILTFDDYLKHLADLKGGFDEVPFLELGHRDAEYLPSIEGHEGRHRSRVLTAKGAKKSLVQLLPSARMAMFLPKRNGEKLLQKMNQTLGENRFVSPEGGGLLPSDQTAGMYKWLKDNNLLDTNRPQLPEVYSKGGNVEPTQDEMRLALTKSMRNGMYSPLEKLAVDVPRTKGTGAEFMAEISKQPGFKAEEVADRKIPMPEGKMSKIEFLRHLRKHSLPPLQEYVLDDIGDFEEALNDRANDYYGDDMDRLSPEQQRDVESWVSQNSVKYKKYQLPGGENYREMLLKLPALSPKEKLMMMDLEAQERRVPPSTFQHTASGVRLQSLRDKQRGIGGEYYSNHWDDIPNVLAHLRLSDREGPEGEKLLHVEELQSDWHQRGRKQGYKTESDPLQKNENGEYVYKKPDGTEVNLGKYINERKVREGFGLSNIPDAPFKKSWHELGLKHVLHHAAQNGYKGVVITPGSEQAERWKDERLKPRYDKNIPEFLNKFGKPFGAKVGQMPIESRGEMRNPTEIVQAIESAGIPMQDYHLMPLEQRAQFDYHTKTVPLHHFPITEPMREKILKEGLPQYMRGGVIHKAEGGNVQPSIAQMKIEMAQKNSNVDLHNIGVNEAPDMSPKHFFPPARSDIRMPSPGGVATPSGMPIGGIDMSRMQGGQQLMPNPLPAPPQPPQGAQPPQGGQPQQPPQGQPPMAAQQGGGNILQMTPQGQMMQALGGQPPRAMADGGGVTVAGATGTGGFDLHIPITTGGGSSGGGSGGGISSLGGMMNQGGSNASSAPSAPPPPTGMYTNRQQFGTPMQNLSNGMGGSAPTNYPKPTSLAQLNAPAGGQNVQPNQPHTGGFNYATGRFNDVYQDPNQTAKTDINPNFMYGAGPTPMPVASSGVSGGQTPTAPINKADYFNERQKSAQEFGRSFDPSPQFMAWMNSPENISWEQYATRGQSSTPTMMYAKGGSATSTEAMKAELAAKKKPKFAIAPSQVPTKGPEHFTPYDKENPSKGGLQTAFDEAISHHLSLSPEDRMKNSVRASEAVGDIIGRTADGKVKDLLGKNAKLLKSEKGKDDEAVKLPDGRGIETTGLALAPAYREGKFDTCPNHHSCKEECLGKTSGNYFKLGGGQDLSEFKGPRLNSLLKTHAFMHDPHNFAVKLHDEISDAKAIAAQNGNHLGLRLNVLSDINPRIHKAIIEAHPDVTFYDYTKNNTNPIAPNHHYTYSSTGVSQPGVDNEHTNWKSMRRRLLGGDNVAMAFSHKDHLPEFVHDQETGHKFRVVNGDTHDFRPLDIQPEGEHGVIVGLKNKKATGEMDKAHVDSKGFFVHYDPQLKMTRNAKGLPVYERKASNRISPKTGKPMLGETIPQNKMVNIQTQTRGMIPISNDGESE
jgi:hypothetical protein